MTNNNKQKVRKHINFALVEETRPAVYRAMKYWGKKPHNIWRKYIDTYTSNKGLYLDPFAGSAISAFEAVRVGKKAIAFDLNPLTSFLIEVLSSDFHKKEFQKKAEEIINKIKKDDIYNYYYSTQCPKCSNTATAQSFKREKKSIYEVGVECKYCVSLKNKFGRSLKKPDHLDREKAKKMGNIKINYWCPDKEFPNYPSFSANFIECVGGNKFTHLWTRRNLYILSKIFSLILKIQSEELKKQLLFGFIQTIHLCTKMSVPRRKEANRPFSTSWGRSAYICSSRQMEMNPLLVFESSCFGRQSVTSSLSKTKEYFGKKIKLLYVDQSNKSNRSKNFDIKYGIIDINNLIDYIDPESIDFIMTDPPYGGLVQYLDLSSIWLVWLEKYSKRFVPNYGAEITIKKGIQNLETYKLKFSSALKNLYKVLKPDGFIVFTFHNKDLKIWNAFLNSLVLAGFKVKKVLHQQNRRTGESNVANPYGTSATDFYIRCIKSPHTELKTDKDEFEHFVLVKAIEIIAQRNEPTPYQFLFNGLLSEISGAGFDLHDFDTNIEKILSKHLNKIFTITENKENKAGKYWWFKNPDEYIKYRDKKLSDRVEESIVSLLRRKISVSLDDVIGEIFIKYPNGLTPDIKSIDKILKQYAVRSGGKWQYKGEEIEREFTEHTRILALLNYIGKKYGFKTFIGKREQSEKYENEILKNLVDFKNLKFLKKQYDKHQLDRLEMIDMLWFEKNQIRYAIEVENSTKFMAGIQRGSNLDNRIPKIMVLPNGRKKEFLRTRDPLFEKSFKNQNWSYIFYSEVEKLKSLSKLKESSLRLYLKRIK